METVERNETRARSVKIHEIHCVASIIGIAIGGYRESMLEER
jgi:hypothetical protein